MTRNVYVLGIDHEIQVFDGKRTAVEKAKFEELLRALVSEHRIEFIGEGCSVEAMQNANIFIVGIVNAFDLIIEQTWCKATLRR